MQQLTTKELIELIGAVVVGITTLIGAVGGLIVSLRTEKKVNDLHEQTVLKKNLPK